MNYRTAAKDNPLATGLILALVLFVAMIVAALVIQARARNADETPTDLPNVVAIDPAITGFDYSAGITEQGKWEGITASDYVELFDYRNIVIPATVTDISEEQVQTAVDALLEEHEIGDELTDQIVTETFGADLGWSTVAQMRAALGDELRVAAMEEYVRDFLRNQVTVSSIPPEILAYQEGALSRHFADYAISMGMGLDEFLQNFVGFENLPDFLANSADDIAASARSALVIQAIAEDANITVTEEDLAHYLPDYSLFVEEFGMPYITQFVLEAKVVDYLMGNAVTTS
ncbi:MAG: hypothetical protein LBB58_02585 [Cellulomonadaceae bacterium]|nr:hypothetical protein [Cellulomonadaceae bacterium]